MGKPYDPNLPSHEQRLLLVVGVAILLISTAGCSTADSETKGGGGATSVGGGPTAGASPAGGGSVGGATSTGGANAGGGGSGAAGGTANPGGSGGYGGAGGGSTALDVLLDALRADPETALLAQSRAPEGWPAPVAGGRLFATTRTDLPQLAGDHDSWTGTAMNQDSGFNWLVLDVAAGNRYKFTDGNEWLADPWSRAYEYDSFGQMSMVAPTVAHLERHFAVGDSNMLDRTVRVWLPTGSSTHVLYVQDGQNLFNPNAMWGGWKLNDSAPAAMMLVGIDNTPYRMDEYTHVTDFISGQTVGGDGDQYADFVQNTVRPLIEQHYGEPTRVGVMGSSLGGLISFHIPYRHPGEYHFAASLSGTMGWGSIGIHNETMIERYQAAGHGSTALYLDSGGNGICFDSDSDGIEDDDPTATDNYCENKQFETVLQAIGYVQDTDMWHWWEPDALHNEAAWAARVWRPLQIFAGL